jgi:hypothetical protein
MKDTDDMQKLFFNEDGREIWPCKHCSRKYIIAGGTLNIEKHLWGKHKVFEESPLEIKLKNQQLSIQESMASSEANPFKRRKLAQDTFDERPLDAGTVESLYVKWISTDNKALRLAGCPEFRAFLTYLNANINVCLPSSATSIGEWVLRQFGIEKERIRRRIQSARSKVHISCDLWTAPNSLPILGVVAHYISEDNILESSTLAMVGTAHFPMVDGEISMQGGLAKIKNHCFLLRQLYRSQGSEEIPDDRVASVFCVRSGQMLNSSENKKAWRSFSAGCLRMQVHAGVTRRETAHDPSTRSKRTMRSARNCTFPRLALAMRQEAKAQIEKVVQPTRVITRDCLVDMTPEVLPFNGGHTLFRFHNDFSKTDARLLAQLRTGQYRLNAYLSSINAAESDGCAC